MWLLQEQRRICIIVGRNQHNEVKNMIEEIFITLELIKIFIFFGWLFGQFDEFDLIGILR